MKHKAWSSIENVPYYFSRSSVKFQGHAGQKIADFNPNWAFPNCSSSFNLPMVTIWCTKLEVGYEKFLPIVFQGHSSNFKVTRDKKSSILTQIGRFRTPVWIYQWLRNYAQSLIDRNNCSYYSTRVDVYSHHILLAISQWPCLWVHLPFRHQSKKNPISKSHVPYPTEHYTGTKMFQTGV